MIGRKRLRPTGFGLVLVRSAAVATLFFAASCANRAAETPGAASNALYDAVAARLAIMPDVARWKYANDRPVEDLAREEAVTAAFVMRAVEAGLDRTDAERIISAQMDAAKRVQAALIADWSRDGAVVADPPDLVAALRPRIDAANDQLVAAAVGGCLTATQRSRPPSQLAAFPAAWRAAAAPFEACN
ncbi:MAG: gamma subclass chorismate mutase AroQ [Pseudomonadota bacterium]